MSQTFPPVRLAALDLDGTLLNHEGQVTPRTRAALQAASDRGVVIVPTTGRPLGNLPPVVAQLPGHHLQRCGRMGPGQRPAGFCLQPVRQCGRTPDQGAHLSAAPPDAGGDCPGRL